MVRDELRNLVKFDPVQVREAIKTWEKEAEALSRQRDEIIQVASLYRQLLRTHGFEEAEPTKPTITPARPQGGESIAASQERRFRGMKLADAAVIVLTENGGRLHAQRIINGLTAGGLKVGGKYPMSTITTAMRRDSRIEKDPTAKNTWRLKM